jgi:hypothetical protein
MELSQVIRDAAMLCFELGKPHFFDTSRGQEQKPDVFSLEK